MSVELAIKNGSHPEARGAMDAYYHRQPDPHVYPDWRNIGERIPLTDPEHIELYMKGYREQEDFKEYEQ